jgi:hypothetical protein
MLLAVLVVLVAVFFVATGRGGELSHERPDHAPLDLGPVAATDVALLRPPTALWGYNVDVTDEALDLIARALRDRDVTIAYLQQQLAERITGTVADPPGALRPQPPRPDPQYLQPWSDWRTPPASEDPSSPASPGAPADPADLADPADWASPGDPADPSGPANPSGPASPSGPSDLADPSGPANPSGPASPSGPSDLADPSGPANPSGAAASQPYPAAEDDLVPWDEPHGEGSGEGLARHEGASGEPDQ